MPSDALIGILTGMGEAYSKRQKNLFDMEMERREKMAQSYERVAEHPAITPEGRDEYLRRAFGIRTLEPNKKLPKEWEQFAAEVAPKFGESWLDGQTSRDTTPQPMPIASDLEGGLSLGNIQGGKGPANGEKVQAMRTPEVHPQQAPMPTPPPGATRSPFYSPREQAQMKMQQAVEMLKAEFGMRLPFEVELAKQKKALEPAEKPMTVPSEAGLYDPERKQWIREPQAKPPNLSNYSPEKVMLNGKQVTVLRDLDPASPTTGRSFLPTPEGLMDVTGKTQPVQDSEPLYPVVENGQVVYRPRSAASGMSAPRTLYDETGLGSVGGTQGLTTSRPPTVDAMTQSNLAGWTLAMDLLDNDVIPQIQQLQTSFGPIVGRMANVQIRDLGGWGTTQAEQELAVNLRRLLMSQAFAEGGKQLTPTEKEEFVALNPALEDTVGQALVKARLSRDYLERRYNTRLAVMPESQRRQLQGGSRPTQGGGGEAPEGTIITNDRGERMVKRNGQWVPQ